MAELTAEGITVAKPNQVIEVTPSQWLDFALKKQEVQDRYLMADIGVKTLSGEKLLEPDGRYHLDGDKLGIFAPEKEARERMGVFFEDLVNAGLNLSERIHSDNYLLEPHPRYGTNPIGEVLIAKAGSDIDKKTGQFLLDGQRAPAPDAYARKVADLARLEKYMGLSEVVFGLTKLTDIPDDTPTSMRQFRTMRHNYELVRGPSNPRVGKSFDVVRGGRDPDLRFSFLPNYYSAYEGYSHLNGADPQEAEEILHQMTRKRDGAADVRTIVDNAKKTAAKPSMRVSAIRDGKVTGSIGGDFIVNPDGTFGFNLKADGFPEHSEFIMRGKRQPGRMQAKRTESPFAPVSRLIDDFSKMSIKPSYQFVRR